MKMSEELLTESKLIISNDLLENQIIMTVEQAALSCGRYMGLGDVDAADQAAVDAMRKQLNDMQIDGKIVIGEGEIDEAPMLFIGEKVGQGGRAVDIAVDPLEGTTILAHGLPNAIAVIAVAEKGNLLHAPDMYMDKLIVGPKAKGKVDIDAPIRQNLESIATSLGRKISDVTVAVLDRDRHVDLIKEIRDSGARIKLIGDGDITAAIAVGVRGTGVHAVMGIGGAPEGVIAAAALKCLGADIQARLWPRNDEEVTRAAAMGISDIKAKLHLEDLVSGEVFFAATGITTGDLLRGVNYFGSGARTHSIVMASETGRIRFIDSIHRLGDQPIPEIHL